MKSKDVALADLEKDVTTARALHAEVDSVRAALDQRSVELAKALEAKDAALQRAEQKIALIEGRIAEQNKAIGAEREAFEERLATLKEQLEAEQSARAFAEGALQAARQERGSRRRDEDRRRPGRKSRQPRPSKRRGTRSRACASKRAAPAAGRTGRRTMS